MNPAFWTQGPVTIVGLGLMGGSLGLALQAQGRRVWAVEPDAAGRELARARGLGEIVAARPSDLPGPSGVVVLAAPLDAILREIANLPGWATPGALLLDLGSTKAQVVQAFDALPEGWAAVGGHPLCGKERGGLAAAEAGLFLGAPFALCATRHTSPAARLAVEALARGLGARPRWFAAETHDEIVAASSQAPFLLANALAAATPPDAAALIGTGFRSTARLAPTPPGMMLPVLAANRGAVLAALDRTLAELQARRERLAAADWSGLAALLDAGSNQYAALFAAAEEQRT